MPYIIIRLLYMFSFYTAINCSTKTLVVDYGTCGSYEIYKVNEFHDYKITWRGGKIPNFCSFGFIGRDSDYENRYKVCVEATGFQVSDCNVKLKYKTGINGVLRKTYGCGDTVSKFCGDSDDYVDVHFETKYGVYLKAHPGNVTLKITAKMTYSYNSVIGWSIGGAVIALFVLSSIITAIVCIVRRRRTPGAIYRNSPALPYVIQTNVYTNGQAMPNTVVCPPVNVQGYTEYAAPPPSYQQVVMASGNPTAVTQQT